MKVPAILIVSPLYPPARGGLADHTRRLAEALAQEAKVTVLTSVGAEAGQGFTVCSVVAQWGHAAAISAAMEKLAGTQVVLWQYVPHMYGRGGVNLAIPKVMAALRSQGRRQIVIAHEIAAPFSIWPHRFWYAMAQRCQWRRIMVSADAIGISTEAWLEQWRQGVPQFAKKLFLAPSPASIPAAALPAEFEGQWRGAQGITSDTRILACFGSLNTSRQFGWMLAAWQRAQHQGQPVALVAIGDRPAVAVPNELRRLMLPVGFQSPAEVSRLLQITDVLGLPFLDGVSERRTTFMAGLAHGLPIVTTYGHGTGSTLRGATFFKAASAHDKSKFVTLVSELLIDTSRRLALGQAAREAYGRDYDWPHVVRKIGEKSLGTSSGAS